MLNVTNLRAHKFYYLFFLFVASIATFLSSCIFCILTKGIKHGFRNINNLEKYFNLWNIQENKHLPYNDDNIENKIVTSVSSQINIIFNLQTYLCFTYVSICLMMVHEKDRNMQHYWCKRCRVVTFTRNTFRNVQTFVFLTACWEALRLFRRF
jgi:hypothetical protein